MTPFIILSIFLFITSSYLFLINLVKNKKLSLLKSEIEIYSNPIRKGYYKLSCTQGDSKNAISWIGIIFVSEIDRYTNGESKIKLDKIELKCGTNNFNSDSAEKYVRTSFISVVITSDITWLESEIAIKEMRKNKLAQLKEKMK